MVTKYAEYSEPFCKNWDIWKKGLSRVERIKTTYFEFYGIISQIQEIRILGFFLHKLTNRLYFS